MGSKIIGRTQCPECDFEAAHVKESDRCVFRYCPECGAQYHARTERQRANLLKRTRLNDVAPVPAPAAAAAPVAKPAAPAPAPAAKRPALSEL